MNIPELELSLFQHNGGIYASARLRGANSALDADISVSTVALDLEELRALRLSDADYAARLTQMLFADEGLARAWQGARAYARRGDLRVRLRCAAQAPELHGVRWELLHDLPSRRPIARMAGVRFSRALDTVEAAPLELAARDELRAAVLVANPGGLGRYGLAPVEVAAEAGLARAALGDIPISTLLSGQQAAPATLDALLGALRQGTPICYIVAHGVRAESEAALLLEDADGLASRVAMRELAARVGELQRKPALVVVAACQSAGASHDPGAAEALGPLLIAAGVPAVIVMRDDVPVDLVRRLLPVFFRELRQDGMVDRAMAAARAALGEDEPWWQPVLYMQLHDGRLWRDAAPEPRRRLAIRWAGAGLAALAAAATAGRLLSAGPDPTLAALSLSLLTLSLGCLALLAPGPQRRLALMAARLPPRPRAGLLQAGPPLLALLLALGVQLALPAIARPYADRGLEQLAAGRPAQALAQLDRAIALHPGDAIAQYHRGIAQEDLARPDLAAASYRAAIEADPELSAAYNNLARLMLRDGAVAEALAFFQQIERRRPQEPPAAYALYKNLGWAALELRSYLQAEQELQRALSYNPGGAAAHCLLARALEERPEPDPARALAAWAQCLRYEFAGEAVEPELLSRARERLNAGVE